MMISLLTILTDHQSADDDVGLKITYHCAGYLCSTIFSYFIVNVVQKVEMVSPHYF